VISRFFIDRPVFAAVLSILIILAGGACVFSLPLSQFPKISPPVVSVSCNYPGASARDVAEAVAAPIEQQVNGVEGMMFMSSSCTNDGSYSLTVTFHEGTVLDMAQVLVQNRVALALPALPDVIKQTGVTVRKRSPDPLCGFALTSPQGRYDQFYLSNFALRLVRDELLRVPGVSDVNLLGQRDISLRIWVNPYRLAARGMTAGDLVQAIREQNTQVATGMLGQQPVAPGQEVQITLDTLGRLSDVEQFENIILKTMLDGRMVRLKDVARLELGAKNHDVSCRFDRRDTAFLVIFQMPDANALETRDLVQAKMDELARNFPEDVVADVAFDTTPYTRESIQEVFKTLRDAVILVAIVVLVFLQNWRAAIIPLFAVPVAVVGTFAAMALFGFSLNNLTLFGLVLAIGIVVDDAIVVVEAVEQHMEHGLPPREATIKAMEQVAGPVIAVGLVLSAVFIPCAFIMGITGHFFRQFALTIAVSTLISAFNSLTLSPALTAWLLRPRELGQPASPLPRLAFALAGGWLAYSFLPGWVPAVWAHALGELGEWVIPLPGALAGAVGGWLVGRPLNWLLQTLFQGFNWLFGQATGAYTWVVGRMLRVSWLMLVLYGGLLVLTYMSFSATAKGFIPGQDMGYLLLNVQLPDSASKERTDAVMRDLEEIILTSPGVRHATTISGQSFVLNAFGSNFGSVFVNLKDYADRSTPDLSSEAIAGRLRAQFAARLYDGNVAVFAPPPVRGVGRAGGFAFVVEDRGDLGPVNLQSQVENLVRKGNQTPGLVGLFSVFRANVPQLKIEPDRRQCMTRGVDLQDFSEALRVYQGSLYINDINLYGRTWQVIVQADAGFRDQVEDLRRLKVRNVHGQMVPLGSLAHIQEVNGPLVLTRYNMYPAATINGTAGPGVSSQQAMQLMQQLAAEELPGAMAYEWTDISYLELLAGNTAIVLFGLAAAMVFLVLAAQYESWSLPLAIILVVPLCILSAIAGVNIARLDINIFTQIGFVVLVGLASKNAILIVEYARSQRLQGVDRFQAVLAACRLRLRPIVMTAMAFILGVVPLVMAHGAGMEMRRALGTAVFSGMIGVTIFGLMLTPVFFLTIDRLSALPWFATGIFHKIGDVAMECLVLGPVRRASRTFWKRGRRRIETTGRR
jgi:multidrug efflux pump